MSKQSCQGAHKTHRECARIDEALVEQSQSLMERRRDGESAAGACLRAAPLMQRGGSQKTSCRPLSSSLSLRLRLGVRQNGLQARQCQRVSH